MPSIASDPKPSCRGLMPRVKVWLECGGAFAFGLGVCEILQAVDRSGSIKQAARDVTQVGREGLLQPAGLVLAGSPLRVMGAFQRACWYWYIPITIRKWFRRVRR